MCLKCGEEVINLPPQVNLIDDDFEIAFELSLFITNIKEVCGVSESFLSFLKRFEEKIIHSMPCLILDPKVKSLCLVSLFIGCEGVNIVEEYHK